MSRPETEPANTSVRTASIGEREECWWRGAVIYQIYPRSFMDSNGDGIGDLCGIIGKLGYVADLGVDAIWVSPFYKSPMKDFGYDVSDYRSIDPVFGTIGDFDRLVEAAHGLGLKVVTDQVLSHTSDQHAWFAESRQSRDNPRAGWYVWADPREDGTPPNNWLSVFGGAAWHWEPRRRQYYLHNFLSSQPDLNYHEPAVVEQMLAEVRFWLERGVDGMRLDAINFCHHDCRLRDNPAKPHQERAGRGYRTDNPYAWQYHRYDNTQPENLEFIRRLRKLADGYSNVALLGEVTGEDPLDTMREYTRGNDRLHMAYNFDLLADDFSLAHIRDAVERLENDGGDCWPCRSIGNHDVARVATRWATQGSPDARSKLLNALVLSLKGSVCCYQGDELGLTQAELAPEDIRDPYGVAFWPLFAGRDGCRTPMPWCADAPGSGFTHGMPWLPVPAEHRLRAVDRQSADPESVLNAYRRFVRWRRTQPALVHGDIRFVDSPDGTLAFIRRHRDEHVLAAFNFSDEPAEIQLPDVPAAQPLTGHGFAACAFHDHVAQIPAQSAFFTTLAPPP